MPFSGMNSRGLNARNIIYNIKVSKYFQCVKLGVCMGGGGPGGAEDHYKTILF